jgi:biotin carboxylase
LTERTPTLLVLGGSTDQMFMIRTARRMGLRTACLDGNPAAPGLALADVSAPIDFSDLPAVFNWLDRQDENFQGVSTMGSDVPHLLAAIGARYGWVAPSLETGRLATDKLAMKECFLAHGVPVPQFSAVKTADDVRRCWTQWGCERVIIKPIDRAGSRGVLLLSEGAGIEKAVSHAQSQGLSGRLILEEFVPGAQISTETVVANGQARTPGFADRVYEGMEGFHPQIMENGGWLPALCQGESLEKEVVDLVEKAAAALGVTNGAAKGDVVVCPRRGPMMIEMAARLSGGDFSEGLVPLSTGVNYVRTVIEIAVGREPQWQDLVPQQNRVVANRYFFPPAGILEEVDLPEYFTGRPEVVKVVLSYGPGEEIPVIRSHGDRAGVMVIVGDSRDQVQELVDLGYKKVRFKIDGRWVTGEPRS